MHLYLCACAWEIVYLNHFLYFSFRHGLTFIYFGITKFIRTALPLKHPLPRYFDPNVIRKDMAWNWEDSEISVHWQALIGMVDDDSQIASDVCASNCQSNPGPQKLFRRWNDTNIFIYCFKRYQRCSDSTWSDWQTVWKVDDDTYHNLQATKELDYAFCEAHQHGLLGHPGLLSYFYDNVQIKSIANAAYKHKGETVKFQNILDKLRALEDPDSNETEEIDKLIFTWENSFLEDGSKWRENTWTQRLCGALLSEYTSDGKYNMEYTAPYGKSIIRDPNCLHYIFHGTPNITIQKANRQDVQAVLLSSENPSSSSNTDEEASMSPYAAVEDSVQIEKVLYIGEVPLIDKIGELLSNMHIVLVKKAFKRLTENVFQTTDSLTLEGMLISKNWGMALHKR